MLFGVFANMLHCCLMKEVSKDTFLGSMVFGDIKALVYLLDVNLDKLALLFAWENEFISLCYRATGSIGTAISFAWSK